MNPASDEDLIRSAVAGDVAAFEQLVLRYQDAVARFIWRLVPDAADREEVCQEVFLKLYLKLDRFRADSKLSTWLYTIAWRQAVSFLRKRDYPVRDYPVDSDSRVEEDGRWLEDELGDDEVGRLVARELSKLGLEERSIVTLFHIQECSIEDISTIVGRPAGTIKSILFRVRKKMKDELMVLLAGSRATAEVSDER